MRRATPKVGEPYTLGAETLIPTYVAESEAPKPDGSCNTRNYVDDTPIDAAGWYVEFRYPGSPYHNRRYIPFEGEAGS